MINELELNTDAREDGPIDIYDVGEKLNEIINFLNESKEVECDCAPLCSECVASAICTTVIKRNSRLCKDFHKALNART